MLTFTDEALILVVDKFGDADAIVQLFTPAHGLCRGVVKRGLTGKNRADVQPATLVEATWKARMPEHLGTITLEARHSYAARVMHDALRLAAVGSVVGMMAASLAERDPHPELYAQAVSFLQHVAAGVEPLIWLGEYVRLELALLELAGFGLDLSRCAATGETADLAYVSPKSGRAVGKVSGQPYHDRMLALPAFVKDAQDSPESIDEVRSGVALTGHFLETRLLPALHRRPPALRTHFIGLLARQNAS
ncbi:MAG: DNA repair protein RecO [Alphaproteobacteria bacterium]|nr:DNA repair protein RecO [Alphaproteobacteria bacterium]